MTGRWTARWLWAALLVGALSAMPRRGAADEVQVPASLQVRLLDRVLSYERGFAANDSSATILIVSRPGRPESERVAAQLAAALSTASTLSGRPIRVVSHRFGSAERLARRARLRAASVVFLSAGFGDVVANIAPALAPPVLLVSAVGADADHGATLGFELVSSRPQIVVNLRSAARQRADFSAQLLRVARVVR